MNPTQTLIANRWFSVFLFIAIATLLSALVGWLIKKGTLPLKPMMAFSSVQWQLMKVWVKVAIVVGGTVALAGWNNQGYGNLVIIDHGNGMICPLEAKR